MKSPFVSDLQPNQVITSTFLVHIKDIRQKKSGEPYLSLVLGDRHGELEDKEGENGGEGAASACGQELSVEERSRVFGAHAPRFYGLPQAD